MWSFSIWRHGTWACAARQLWGLNSTCSYWLAAPPQKSSDSYLDTQELVHAIFKFNEEADEGDRWFVASKLIADLLKVKIKERNRALADLEGAIENHHAEFDLNHTANRTNRLSDLVTWLKQHFSDLQLRDEFYE